MSRESGFLIVKYGARTIALAGTPKDAEQYVLWHQELKEVWKSDRMVGEVQTLARIRDDIVADIDEVLAGVLVDGRVPGHCEGCP